MRPDVKLGVVLAAVIVLVAGTYFFYRDSSEEPISISGGPDQIAGSGEKRPASGEAGTKRPATADRRTPRSGPGVAQPRRPKPRVVRRPTDGSKPESAKEATKPEARVAEKDPRAATTEQPEERRPLGPGGERVARTPDDKSGQPQGRPTGGESEATTAAPAARDRVAGAESGGEDGGTEGEAARRVVPLTAEKAAATPTSAVGRPTAADDAAVDRHRVQPGETLSALAARYYGSSALVEFLIRANPQLENPDRLRVGEIVRIPPRPEGAPAARTASADRGATRGTSPEQRTYVVQPGDSFYRIASRELGSAVRWRELFELNRDRVGGEPRNLQAGQVIVLPPAD